MDKLLYESFNRAPIHDLNLFRPAIASITDRPYLLGTFLAASMMNLILVSIADLILVVSRS
jgi:hypothetical protein